MRELTYISLLVLIANTNLFSQTELINAIRNFETTKAISLINNGANVNEYLAHEENHNHTEKCLGHNYNRTALFWAVLKGNTELVGLLLEKGANINFINVGGKTALHIAVQTYNLEILELLINNNSDINIKDQNGNTPLLLASYNYSIETNKTVKEKIKKIIIFLLENNAEITTENAQNKKPTDFKIINELLKNQML